MYVNAKKESNELPGVSIGDDSIENSGWKSCDGWHGLVPSLSSLEDAKAVLGPVTGVSELANGVTYDFLEGKVRLTFRNGTDSVVRIWIAALAPKPFTPPQNIEQLRNAFGKFATTGVSRNEGAIFERPGMRACCNAMDECSSLCWLEIFAPL